MENLGKMRENHGKPMKIYGKIRRQIGGMEKWRKTEEHGRKWKKIVRLPYTKW